MIRTGKAFEGTLGRAGLWDGVKDMATAVQLHVRMGGEEKEATRLMCYRTFVEFITDRENELTQREEATLSGRRVIESLGSARGRVA